MLQEIRAVFRQEIASLLPTEDERTRAVREAVELFRTLSTNPKLSARAQAKCAYQQRILSFYFGEQP